MMRFTVFFLLCFAFAASQASQQPDADITVLSDDLQVYPLNQNLWVHRSWASVAGVRYPANGLLIQQDDTLVLIDTAWGNESTQLLLDWVGEQFGKQPDMAILTHAHADRIGGLPALAAHHIPARVHPKTLALAEKTFPPEQHPTAITELNDATTSKVAFLSVFYPGAAHSPDNIVVWYDSMKLLFGGCAVKSASAEDIHYVEGSDANGWESAIGKLIARYPDTEIVVPGHGPVGDAQLLRHTRDLARQGQKH